MVLFFLDRCALIRDVIRGSSDESVPTAVSHKLVVNIEKHLRQIKSTKFVLSLNTQSFLSELYT